MDACSQLQAMAGQEPLLACERSPCRSARQAPAASGLPAQAADLGASPWDEALPPVKRGARLLGKTASMESCSTTASPSAASDMTSESDDTEEARPAAVPLRGAIQHYAWGRPGSASLVAAMAGAAGGPSSERRFAELWMGTHPNGHSCVLMPGAEGAQEGFLKATIERDPTYWLGEDSSRGDIPYLLKVLSVNKALSIQAHPNKQLAEQLHRRSPEHYPDDNHKPEICIPLGHFEALCGFRPLAEVRRYVRDVAELRRLCCAREGPESRSLKDLYCSLMHAEAGLVRQQVDALVARLGAQEEPRSPEEELVLRVAQDYPGDVGIFSIFFLNYVRIGADERGRYIYCAPDEPHAYLCGEAVECMAISDNVVRAGLTSKHKDVETLLGMLTYRDDLLQELVGTGERVSANVIKYDPPVEDFVVYEVTGPVPEGLYLAHAAITTCVSGSFSVAFQAVDDVDGDSGAESPASGRAEALQWASMGSTFFSRAGTELVVTGMEGPGRLFVASF